MKGVFARTNPELVLLFELLQAHRTDLKGRGEVDICYYSPFSFFSWWIGSKLSKTQVMQYVLVNIYHE